MHPSGGGRQSSGSFGAAGASFFRYGVTTRRYALVTADSWGAKALFPRRNVLPARLLTYFEV